MQRRPENLLQEVNPRSASVVIVTIVATIVAVLLGLGAWAILRSWLATPSVATSQSPSEMSESGRVLAFALVFLLFLFFLRTSVVAVIGIVTGRAGRFPLVPWWFGALFVAGLFVLGVLFAILALRDGDMRGLARSATILLGALTFAAPVALLRRSQRTRTEPRREHFETPVR